MSSIPALSASSLLTARSQGVFSRIVPAAQEGTPLYNVWKYMFLCFDTPRPSHKEDAMRKKVRKRTANYANAASSAAHDRAL